MLVVVIVGVVLRMVELSANFDEADERGESCDGVAMDDEVVVVDG